MGVNRIRHTLFDRLRKEDNRLWNYLDYYSHFFLVLLYKLLNKIVPDEDKNKDKRSDIERWEDHNYYRG